MKRFLTMIVAVFAVFAVSAQFPMVTLSHNGELSFFTNVGAFKSAYDAAENGDTLYLSEGLFNIDGGSMKIEKRLSIVGSGYGSYLLGTLTLDLSDKMNAPLFDGVRIPSLIFTNTAYSNTSNPTIGETEIRRCWIGKLLNASYGGTDLTIDQCFIEDIQYSTGTNNTLLKNSKFHSSGSDSYKLTAINCNIFNPEYYPRYTVSCILTYATVPSAVSGTMIINSLLIDLPTSSNAQLIDCYTPSDQSITLLDDNFDCPLNLTELGYLGQDGTEVGIHGGESHFYENPSVPTVDTANSSVEYDSSANKLKVNITVKAD